MNSKLKNISKIISFIVILSIMLFLVIPRVEAASFSITSGISTITKGEKYTISISAKGLTGKFDISHSSNVSVNVSSVWVENGVADSEIVVTTKSEGEATVTVTPSDVSDSNTGDQVSLASKTDRVTVKAKSSNNGGSNNSGSSGSDSGSSSSGSSGESSKPKAPSFTEVNETVYATDSVNVRSSYSTSSNVIGSLDKGDSVTRIGKSSSWSKVKYNGQTAYISSDYLTTKKPEEEKKSNNNNLKSLEVVNYKLSPEFNKDITEYDLKVTDEVESLEVKAIAEDGKAKVKVTGNDKLLTGVNTIEIKVTAEDETVRTYKINVTKGEATEEGTGLSELTVDGYTLTPEFSSNVHEYTVNIADPSVTSININTKAFEENAKVEVIGNEELKLGENIVTILVTSEDGKNTYTYQLVVNITEKTEENNQIIAGIDDKDLYMYVGIGVVVLVVIIIIIVIVKRRNKDDDDFAPYYGGFGPLNNKDNDNDNKDDLFGTINTNSSKEEIKPLLKKENETENALSMDTEKNDLNSGIETSNINKKTEDETRKKRKSVIEENFGAGIDYTDFSDDDRPKRRKGKHSK